MRVYTVHAPASFGVDVRTTPDKVVFVRDGFYFWALFGGALWLIWHRLWLALFGYAVVIFAVEAILRVLSAPPFAVFFVMGIIALLLGLEAGSLRRWKLSRGRWRQLDIIAAPNEQAAEQRFFDRWVMTKNNDTKPQRLLPPLPRSSISSGDVMGFFPEQGTPR
jgi:hypothetical protein